MSDDIQPMPDDWAPRFVDDGRALSYRATALCTLDGRHTEVKVEMGKRSPKTEAEAVKAHADLRAEAWRVHEMVRLGRLSEVRGFTADRHKRPAHLIKKPDISPELEAELRTPREKQMLSGDAQ
jgi:hypothetical protein